MNSDNSYVHTSPFAVKYPDEIVPFKGQRYADIVIKCQLENVLFRDDKFSTDPAIHFKDLQEIRWMRPHEICKKPVFLQNSSPFGIRQCRHLHDCWFVAALSTLMEKRELMENLTPAGQSFEYGYCGVFRFRFFQQGQLVEVVVDDRLPVIEDQSANGTVQTIVGLTNAQFPDDFWCTIVEKAYAKLYGSYSNIDYGSGQEAFLDLAGSITESLSSHKMLTERDSNSNHIVKTLERKGMAVCLAQGKSQFIRKNGIMENHIYSIHRAIVHNNIVMLLVRNPHNNDTRWNGSWSWKDILWTRQDIYTKRILKYDLYYDTSFFWMCMYDFVQQFASVDLWHSHIFGLYINRNYSLSSRRFLHTYRFHGFWLMGKNSFEIITDRQWQWPKLYLEINTNILENPTIYITLSQLYGRQRLAGSVETRFHPAMLKIHRFKYPLNIHFNLYNALQTESNFDLVACSTGPGTSSPLNLFAQLTQGTYVVSAGASNLKNDREFMITVHCNQKVVEINMEKYWKPNVVPSLYLECKDANTRHSRRLQTTDLVLDTCPVLKPGAMYFGKRSFALTKTDATLGAANENNNDLPYQHSFDSRTNGLMQRFKNLFQQEALKAKSLLKKCVCCFKPSLKKH